MTLRIINDTHLGVHRSGGTTLSSRWALRQFVLERFAALMPEGKDLMILGDLFDTHEIDSIDVYRTIRILSSWLYKNKSSILYLVAGNHDLSKVSTTFSSFDLLCNMLVDMHSDTRVKVIKEPSKIAYGYVIPHLPNQAAFDEALAQVPECQYLFLHVNYDNNFAAQSDQSLNISKEQVEACKAKFIISGHEHQEKKTAKIWLPGNQIASSVADWVTNGNGKIYLEISEIEGVTKHVCAVKVDEFVEQDWKQLEVTDHKFVRVAGTATAGQAAQVVAALADFRQKSPALVVTNAVQIAANGDTGAFQASLEATRGFDVWAALANYLNAEQMQTLRGLQ